jgi:N,N-dimethylformamidase
MRKQMTELPVRAYTSSFSYERGQTLSLHVNADGPVSVSLIRMRSSSAVDPSLDSPVEWSAAGSYASSKQETCVGSFLVGEPAPRTNPPHAMSFGAFIWSGDFSSADTQTVIAASGGAALQLRNGRPALVSPDLAEPLVLDMLLTGHSWYFLVGSFGGELSVGAIPVDPSRGLAGFATDKTQDARQLAIDSITVGARDGHGVVASGHLARGFASEHFNGKIESPFVAGQPVGPALAAEIVNGHTAIDRLDLLAAWDLSFVYGDEQTKAAPIAAHQPAGVLVNGPARGVTGRHFSGRSLDFSDAPSEYAAVHFHSTDLADAGWDAVLDAALPEDLDSGVYGVVVESDSGSDVVPIVVAPRATDNRNKVLVVLPTFTYLAYANEAQFAVLDSSEMTGQEVKLAPEDLARAGDSSFGLSLYDSHADGSGVMFSSTQRQIVNMRRGYEMWLVGGAGRAFSSDMYLIEWLARRGIDVDVITDHEVHARGSEYLRPYATILTGSHPEYISEEILDGFRDYRDHGGSLLYLGANGWYWVTGVLNDDPLVVEIRRGQAGTRPWESLPGEVTLMSTGRPGGLWRHRGRPPQALFGIGFAAQGWGSSQPYFRSEAASRPEWAWVFDGVEDDPIGAYGLVMGGAAGDEIDRVDVSLGTPPDAVVLASSRGHSNLYQRVVEETPTNHPDQTGGQQDPEVHADIVYFKTASGGEVFSTGSIAWSGSLLHNETDNGVSRMTENVIRAFVERRTQQE